MKYFALLFLIFGCIACSSDNTADTAVVPKEKVDEDPLVQRYMSEMAVNVKGQNDIDRNIIINYLIDSLLDYRKTDSGIYYTIDEPGTGGYPKLNSKVTCHYRGTLLNGSVFDSSYKKGKPLEFTLGGVIAGWQEVIPMLQKGGKGTFIIPSRLAYEQNAVGKVIPPNSILKFDIELLGFK